MSEQDLREGLREAVAGEPPLEFDPDRLIARARQDVRRRRAMVAATAATLAVASAAVAVPTILGSPRGGAGPATQPSGSSSSAPPTTCTAWVKVAPSPGAPTTWSQVPVPTDLSAPDARADVLGCAGAPAGNPPTATVEPRRYTVQELRKRAAEMRQFMLAHFAEIVPGARDLDAGEFGGEAAGSIAEGQTYLEAFTGFTLNGARTAVDVHVAAPGPDAPNPNDDCTQGPTPDCTMDRRADGSLMSIKREDAGGTGRIVSVTHYRSDGTVVRASGYNYDPTGRTAPTYLPDIPVTVDQLVALAIHPALAL